MKRQAQWPAPRLSEDLEVTFAGRVRCAKCRRKFFGIQFLSEFFEDVTHPWWISPALSRVRPLSILPLTE